ncbi:MAG: hypothetical protein ACERKJ_07575 [Candidatus Dadabacteria bacterium]|jgi:uncharacterized membrane protein YagU involved in acid resistance
MNAFIFTIVAGLVGTLGMSLAMWLITKSGIANAEMIRAIGSLFTKSYDKSFEPGLIVHLISGILFAFLYVILISIFAPTSLVAAIGAGAMIGVFHGVAFGFLLVVTVAEHHPLEQFRNAGFEVAIAHFVGHVIYGILVGLVVGLSGARIFLLI